MSFLVTNIASPNENIQVVKNEQTFNKGKQVITLGPADIAIVDEASTALRQFETDSKVSIVDYAGQGEIFVYMSVASAGGAATEAMTFAGFDPANGDEILSVDQATKGANSAGYLENSLPVADGLSITWSADPGAGAIMKLTVLKAG